MRLRPIADLLLLAVSVLPGCGEEGSAPARESAASTTGAGAATAPAGAAAKGCRAQLGEFVTAMDSLRDGLLAGLTYESYVAEVRRLRRAYEGIPVRRLPLACLLGVGRPGERALNEYVDAANAWGDCLAESSCAPESIEARLQGSWERASGHLGAALEGLPGPPRG